MAELQPIIQAIEVLLDAKLFKTANELYLHRLENGHVFKWIPAPHEGLRCARGFVEPADRKQELEKSLGSLRLAYFINEVALWGSITGQMENVERHYAEHNKSKQNVASFLDVSIGLLNLSETEALLGSLQRAVWSATEARFYGGLEEGQNCRTIRVWMGQKIDDNVPQQAAEHKSVQDNRITRASDNYLRHEATLDFCSRAARANALSLAGQLTAASHEFTLADAIHRRQDPDNDGLHSLLGIQWSLHRIRLGETATVVQLTTLNRAICESKGWCATRNLCDLLLGQLDWKAGEHDSATRRISNVVQVFRGARQGRDLPDALLAQARLRRSVDDCEESHRLAARSGFALKQCDALNLRASIRREAGEHYQAAKDAHHALEIAERCGYYWGRHEALRQLCASAKASGNRADEKHWAEAERELNAYVEPKFNEAVLINLEHDKRINELYNRDGSK